MKKINEEFHKMFDEIRIHCINLRMGCDETFTYNEIEKH
jgi:hypothetical protein